MNTNDEFLSEDDMEKFFNEEEHIPYVYSPKTDQELRQIARDLAGGLIFSDRHLKDPQLIPMTFMILSLMDDRTAEELEEQEVSFIYEDVTKSMPRAINGHPMFMSCNFLNRVDAEKMFEYHSKIQEALSSISED